MNDTNDILFAGVGPKTVTVAEQPQLSEEDQPSMTGSSCEGSVDYMSSSEAASEPSKLEDKAETSAVSHEVSRGHSTVNSLKTEEEETHEAPKADFQVAPQLTQIESVQAAMPLFTDDTSDGSSVNPIQIESNTTSTTPVLATGIADSGDNMKKDGDVAEEIIDDELNQEQVIMFEVNSKSTQLDGDQATASGIPCSSSSANDLKKDDDMPEAKFQPGKFHVLEIAPHGGVSVTPGISRVSSVDDQEREQGGADVELCQRDFDLLQTDSQIKQRDGDHAFTPDTSCEDPTDDSGADGLKKEYLTAAVEDSNSHHQSCYVRDEEEETLEHEEGQAFSPTNSSYEAFTEDYDADDLQRGPKSTLEVKEAAFHHEQFHMREVIYNLSGGSQIRFNPVSTAFAILVLWGVSIWCMVQPEDANSTLIEWRGRLTELFTWFYIGTNPIFMFFLIWVGIRFRHVRLGPRDSRPEFDDVTYFAMLFSAGIGIGLFFFGILEPLWHQSSHWFSNPGYRSADEVDMFAINLTVFHWGLAGWGQYLIVALCAGLAAFRFNLPFTLRSCFYPLLGEYTWGWIGDIVDGFTIVTTVAGVCTSLGLGAFQLAAGLQYVGAIDEGISEERLQTVHVLYIWVITCIATSSVISGLNLGMKYLSQLGFGLGMVLLTLVFIMEKTNFLLNLIVQEVGFYFQWSVFTLNFHTDAFGQLRESEGRAVDGKAAAAWWMDAWTIFYIGSWVSWAVFVGLFIARISKGRTIGSMMLYSYVAPLGYTILWFCVFGGAGLRQSRQALELEKLGETYFNDTEYFMAPDSTYCYDVPQEDIYVISDEGEEERVFTNFLEGVTPVCTFNTDEPEYAWFNVLNSFSYPNDFGSGFGNFLCWLSLFTLAVCFITSSDSGSLIVDNIASNGFEHTHWIQRVFWAFTEGSVATALLVTGGGNALRGLQAASIISGLPFTVLLAFMCMSIYRMCERAEKNDKEEIQMSLQDEYKIHRTFQTPPFGGVFNVVEHALSWGEPHQARAATMPMPAKQDFIDFFVATVAPFVVLFKIYSKFSPKKEQQTGNRIMTGIYTSFFLLWVVLFACIGGISHGLRAFGWIFFLFNGFILSRLRMNFRARHNIAGNIVADCLLSTFFWPPVLIQLMEELEFNTSNREVDV